MYTWIDTVIMGINEACCTNDVYEICNIMGIIIEKVESTSILLKHNDSLYVRDFYNREIIFIKNNLDEHLEKFILLHELGHALIHTELQQAAFNRNFINTDKLEKQANYFAFKMMNVEFDEVELEGFTLEQICRSIGVPYEPILQFINI